MSHEVAGDPDTPGGAGYPWTPDSLASLRGSPRRRRIALAVALAFGIGLGWVHWIGLVVGGVLVGLLSETLPKAITAGVVLGVLVLIAHVLASPSMGVLEFLAVTPLSYVSVAVAIVAPVWGSVARAVV